MSSMPQQNDIDFENHPVFLVKEQLHRQHAWSIRLMTLGKRLEQSCFVFAAAGILLVLLEGGEVHHSRAKILLFLISTALLFSSLFTVILICSFDALHHRFWNCPDCGGELPFLTIPRTFLFGQKSIQNPDLYDRCVKKKLRCVRLPGSNLLIPSRCPHCGEKFWVYQKTENDNNPSIS